MKTATEMAAEYIAHGWQLCRIAPGSKGPRYDGWNLPGAAVNTFPLGHGMGLLHAYSNSMALDVDNYPVAAAWLAERGVDLDALIEADDAVRISSGKVDSAKLLYACPERIGKACAPYMGVDVNGKPREKMALDFRCATATGNSQQDVLPPSIHPKQQRPYVWEFGMWGDWRSLPTIPTALEAIWDDICAPVTTAAATVAAPSGAAPERIQQWLNTQDPGMCRNDWVKVGAKLHAEFQGSNDGFNIWCAWSARDPKWLGADENGQSGSVEAYPVWKSFKLEGRALATLDADVRSMPASVDEFQVVTPQSAEVVGNAAVGEIMEAETASERGIRELMQEHVVLQTGGGKRYFLMPGHTNPAIRSAAGLAGQELGGDQLNNIFGPYMPPISNGKTVVVPMATDVMRMAKWRRIAHRVSFHPGGDEFFTEGDGLTYLNAYKPIPIEPIKPRPHQIEPLLWLMRRVLDDRNQTGGGVFIQWMRRLYAYALTNPGNKVKWAPLLYSKLQGTGKTTLMQTLPSLLFGSQYVSPMNHTVLRERFAGAQFDATWWVALQEMHSDAGKVDARTIANKLKPWITDATIQIEKKGVDSYAIRNHLQFTAMSNHSDALYLEEGEGDRRWLVGRMMEQRLSTEEMTMLNPLFGEDDVRDKRATNWLHWYFLNEVDISGFTTGEPPPETMAKREVREQSRSVWEDAIQEALYIYAPPFDKELTFPTDITNNLLIGHRVSLAQARDLLEKAGLRVLERRFDFTRSIYCRANHAQWMTATPSAIRAYMGGGPRPFTVDDGADLL